MIKTKINTRSLTRKQIDKILEDKNTINLRWTKSTNQRKQTREQRKARLRFEEQKEKRIAACLLFLLTCVMSIFVLGNISKAEAKHMTDDYKSFIRQFPLEKMVIGCYNKFTKETRDWYVCSKPWDHNIILPSRSDITIWLKYYTPEQVVNRLALVNFESSFNIYAQNKYAKWYVQTLKSYNIAIDIDSQLSWMKNRNKTYKKTYYSGKYWKTRWCGYYWTNNNIKDWVKAWEYWVLACLYRYHYDANKGSWYAKRWIITTIFYKNYLRIR